MNIHAAVPGLKYADSGQTYLTGLLCIHSTHLDHRTSNSIRLLKGLRTAPAKQSYFHFFTHPYAYSTPQ
jgi:hypothetical protein